jgi:hypothetical protein
MIYGFMIRIVFCFRDSLNWRASMTEFGTYWAHSHKIGNPIFTAVPRISEAILMIQRTFYGGF